MTLRGRLEGLPARSPERRHLILGCADLHDVSIATIYRALREQFRPRSLHRRDRGSGRDISPARVSQPDRSGGGIVRPDAGNHRNPKLSIAARTTYHPARLSVDAADGKQVIVFRDAEGMRPCR